MTKRVPLPGGIGDVPKLIRFLQRDKLTAPQALPLDYIEERASAFLNENGFVPGTFVADDDAGPSNISDDVRDARYIQLHCRWLRHAIEHGIAGAAAKYAFVLATLLANNKLMSEWGRIAPLAEHGNTMLQGQSNIGKANRRREKERQPERWRCREAADEIRKAHPSWAKRRIARWIFETIQPPPQGKGKIKDSSIIKRIERWI